MNENDEEYAIFCSGLSKEFYIIDESINWRIVFRSPKKSPSTFKALENINLSIPKGKFVGILGRNGAGKSTLLRTLGGVYHPSSGVIKVNGQVSSLFEMGGFGNSQLTGHEYAKRFLDFAGVKKAQQADCLQNIHEFSELGEDFFKPVYSYSSGMAARLYFATATELQHEIYLVDELLSVGDEHFQAKCWKRLRERFTHGASGILVTHDWSAVLKLCELSCILDKGQIIKQGPSNQIVQQYLNLPKPSTEYVEIIPRLEASYESAKDTVFLFDLMVKKEIPLEVSYSIEIFRGGFGWELVLLNEDFQPIHCQLGINHLAIEVKDLPLAPGEYFLNIFLRSPDSSIDNSKIDSRSWTYGNEVKINVTGNETKAKTVLPWELTMEVQ